MMTLTEPLIWMWPVTLEPDAPMIVLLEPTVRFPLRLPETMMTAAVVPAAAVLNAETEVTVVLAALPPPVVVDTLPIVQPLAAQPTSPLGLLPPVPVVPAAPVVPAV